MIRLTMPSGLMKAVAEGRLDQFLQEHPDLKPCFEPRSIPYEGGGYLIPKEVVGPLAKQMRLEVRENARRRKRRIRFERLQASRRSPRRVNGRLRRKM